MNNDALVAALGMDAVAAVHGYRQQVISEADRRGLRLVSEALSDVVQLSTEVYTVVDPIDIRLAVLPCRGRGRGDLADPMLRWDPAHGWSLSYRGEHSPRDHYAGTHAAPLDLVPTAAEVVAWAISVLDGHTVGHRAPPRHLDLDDDPGAIRLLLGFASTTQPEPGQTSRAAVEHNDRRRHVTFAT
ncbi:MAG: hypothetical protein H0U22_15750 [Geodermatophilaceae bacterium]|nr:hypothetical protein [Geodermatophilaceae bacterium]